MRSDRLSIGYDEDRDGAYIVVMREQGDEVKMLVGLHGDQARELYRCLTEQGYAMARVSGEVEDGSREDKAESRG